MIFFHKNHHNNKLIHQSKLQGLCLERVERSGALNTHLEEAEGPGRPEAAMPKADPHESHGYNEKRAHR